MEIQILVRQAVFKLWIMTVEILFWSFANLNFNAIFQRIIWAFNSFAKTMRQEFPF